MQLDVSVFSDKKQMILFLEAHIGQVLGNYECYYDVITRHAKAIQARAHFCGYLVYSWLVNSRNNVQHRP